MTPNEPYETSGERAVAKSVVLVNVKSSRGGRVDTSSGFGFHYFYHHQRHHWRNPCMCFSSSWFVLIVFSCSSWLTSQYGQVTCLYQHSSMERRNCSEFLEEDYPQITVRRNGGGGAGGGGDFGGDQEFTGSFQIDEHMLLDHEVFYFKCVAKYPIEWISNEQSNNHAVSIAEMFCACLIIFAGSERRWAFCVYFRVTIQELQKLQPHTCTYTVPFPTSLTGIHIALEYPLECVTRKVPGSNKLMVPVDQP